MSAVPTSAPAPITATEALAGTFTRPGLTFERLIRRPTWWLPFVLLFAAVATSIFLMTPKLDMERSIRERFEKREAKTGQSLPPAMVDRAVERAKQFMWIAVPIGSFAFAIFFFGAALILWGAAKAFGAETGFESVLALWSHASLANVVGSIVAIPLILSLAEASVTQNEAAFVLKSNVGAFLSSETPPFVRTLAGSIDVFALATLTLLIIGFRRLPGLTKATGTAVPVILWVMMVIAKAAFAGLGG